MSTYPKIVYGEVTFSREDIQSATLIEEFSPLSIILPTSRLEVQIYTEDLDFSIVNPSGKFEALLERNPVSVYEVSDSKTDYIGQYFLDEWDNSNDRLVRLTFTDLIGLLDGDTCRGGMWLTPITVSDLLSELFTGSGVMFEVDPDLADQTLTGWIPICSYREALQQVAFAAGAYAKSARQGGFIKLGKLEPAVAVTKGIRCGVGRAGAGRLRQLDFRKTQWFVFSGVNAVTRGVRSGVGRAGQTRIWQKRWRQAQWDQLDPIITIPMTKQGMGRTLGLRSRVTGVALTLHDIVAGTGTINLYDGTLTKGVHEITFSQPAHTLSVTGASIVESGVNYAVLSVAEAGNVSLTGLAYEDTQTVRVVSANLLPGTKENVVQVTDATMVNSNNGNPLAQRLFDYYQQRYLQKATLFAPTVQPGWSVVMDTLYGRVVKGVVEKMEIDLAGGYLADVEVVGIVD